VGLGVGVGLGAVVGVGIAVGVRIGVGASTGTVVGVSLTTVGVLALSDNPFVVFVPTTDVLYSIEPMNTKTAKMITHRGTDTRRFINLEKPEDCTFCGGRGYPCCSVGMYFPSAGGPPC
jgi:hypothetical protein